MCKMPSTFGGPRQSLDSPTRNRWERPTTVGGQHQQRRRRQQQEPGGCGSGSDASAGGGGVVQLRRTLTRSLSQVPQGALYDAIVEQGRAVGVCPEDAIDNGQILERAIFSLRGPMPPPSPPAPPNIASPLPLTSQHQHQQRPRPASNGVSDERPGSGSRLRRHNEGGNPAAATATTSAQLAPVISANSGRMAKLVTLHLHKNESSLDAENLETLVNAIEDNKLPSLSYLMIDAIREASANHMSLIGRLSAACQHRGISLVSSTQPM